VWATIQDTNSSDLAQLVNGTWTNIINVPSGGGAGCDSDFDSVPASVMSDFGLQGLKC
jgi:hypothetical protein